jgi:hypothetical protein
MINQISYTQHKHSFTLWVVCVVCVGMFMSERAAFVTFAEGLKYQKHCL